MCCRSTMWGLTDRDVRHREQPCCNWRCFATLFSCCLRKCCRSLKHNNNSNNNNNTSRRSHDGTTDVRVLLLGDNHADISQVLTMLCKAHNHTTTFSERPPPPPRRRRPPPPQHPPPQQLHNPSLQANYVVLHDRVVELLKPSQHLDGDLMRGVVETMAEGGFYKNITVIMLNNDQ